MKDRKNDVNSYRRKSAFCIYFLIYILGLIDAVYKENILVSMKLHLRKSHRKNIPKNNSDIALCELFQDESYVTWNILLGMQISIYVYVSLFAFIFRIQMYSGRNSKEFGMNT